MGEAVWVRTGVNVAVGIGGVDEGRGVTVGGNGVEAISGISGTAGALSDAEGAHPLSNSITKTSHGNNRINHPHAASAARLLYLYPLMKNKTLRSRLKTAKSR